MKDEYSDIELLERFQKGNKNYIFNLIVRKYQKPLYWHIRKMVIVHEDADDILQDVFIKIWKSLINFRYDSKLYTWMYKIATNETLTFLKKKRKKFFLNIVDVEKELSEKIEENFYDGDEIQLKLQKSILKLPEKQRLIFNMKYFDHMKYNEISKILGTSVGSLKASYHIAKKKIEVFLKND
ncbi:MAG: RNA polymerase subunit sigma [Bacteroidetes bacterium 4572_128]|nr:MAG: RNA polymerase subunit sigma [Bacteroidetes bacterium 4572_128]